MSCVWVPLQSEVNIILPPQTYTDMPLLFNDNKLGMFDKSVVIIVMLILVATIIIIEIFHILSMDIIITGYQSEQM